MVTATMLTEATGPVAARDYATLRAHAGTAPVTKRSGKRAFRVHMRYACKRRLRQALYHWSRDEYSARRAPRARTTTALRARGHSHARALRSVADRWLRILVAMLRPGRCMTPHDSSRPRLRPLDKWWEVSAPTALARRKARARRLGRPRPAPPASEHQLKRATGLADPTFAVSPAGYRKSGRSRSPVRLTVWVNPAPSVPESSDRSCTSGSSSHDMPAFRSASAARSSAHR